MSPSYCLVSLALSFAVYLLFRFLFDSLSALRLQQAEVPEMPAV